MFFKNGIYIPPLDDSPVNSELERAPTSNWAFDHAAALDAHTYNWGQKLTTGQYHYPWPYFTTATVAIAADGMRAFPFWVPRNMTIDRIAVEVTVAAAAGKACRLGIYNDGINCYPGALSLDAGTVAIDAVAVVALNVNKALTKGLHWFVMLANDTATYKQFAPTMSPMGVTAGNLTTWNGCLSVAQAYGALPNPFTAGGVFVAAGAITAYRLLSLD